MIEKHGKKFASTAELRRYEATSAASETAERCKMVTYGGMFIMAGPAPRGIKPERCPLPALPNGFCEKHDPKDW